MCLPAEGLSVPETSNDVIQIKSPRGFKKLNLNALNLRLDSIGSASDINGNVERRDSSNLPSHISESYISKISEEGYTSMSSMVVDPLKSISSLDSDDYIYTWSRENRLDKVRALCTEVFSCLFVSGATVAADLNVLLFNEITHIVNAAGNCCGNYFKDNFTYLTLYLEVTYFCFIYIYIYTYVLFIYFYFYFYLFRIQGLQMRKWKECYMTQCHL